MGPGPSWCSGPLCPVCGLSPSREDLLFLKGAFGTKHAADPHRDLPGLLAGLAGDRERGLRGQLAALRRACLGCVNPVSAHGASARGSKRGAGPGSQA